MAKIVLQTSRFLFSEEVTELLTEFSKIHQYDERKDYKEAWANWIQEPGIQPALDAEVERIRQQGFDGDVLDKMFKSVRYYYRKKHSKNINDEDDDKDLERSPRTYDTLPINVLAKIDHHIKSQIKSNIYVNNEVITSTIKPATCFDNFCQENKNLIVELLDNVAPTNDVVKQLIAKLKKSYKNRYYNIKVSIEKTQ